MSNSPAFQYYPADLLTDTEVMFWDMERLGCYWQMITFLWLNEGKFEYNLEKLCKLFRVNHKKTAEKLWKNIEIKFQNSNGTITHKRILEEMQKQADTRLMRQEAGREGAKKRWAVDSQAKNLPMAKNSSSTPTTNTIPIPTSLIGIEESSLDSEGLGLKKTTTVEAIRFCDQLAEIFRNVSKHEATTFARIAQFLSEQVRSGQVAIGVFTEVLSWAAEAMAAGVENPKGLFVAKVKQQTGFTGRGKLLK